MLFSSPPFFLFFAIYFALYLTLPRRAQLPLILAGSTIFYGYWNVYYVWIPLALTMLAHFGVRWIGSDHGPSRRRRLAVVLAALLLPLVVVKYVDFLYAQTLGPVFGGHGKILGLPLPLGVSFMTFTMIAYVVDVYRGRYPVEHRASLLAGLVLFFPHLIAGPILRPHELLPQLERPWPKFRRLGLRARLGLSIFSVGLLKKLVFADPMAQAVDAFYANPGGSSLADHLLAFYGFALQIYCDFSGYTDMAIGTALILGVRLPINFQRPYTAASVIEFWQRWHMTLSAWLRDYLYIPLGGNRRGFTRQIVNLLVTMGLGGLWHGANWTFVVWGLAHGSAIGFVHGLRRSGLAPWIGAIPRWVCVLLTFHFVAICWILFRAPDIGTAARIIGGFASAPLGDLPGFLRAHAFELLLLGIFLLSHRWDSHTSIRKAAFGLPNRFLWPLVGLIWALAIAVSAGSSAKFIYFDF